MQGFKSFHSAKETISGIENIRIIQKGQINRQEANQSAFGNFVELMAIVRLEICQNSTFLINPQQRRQNL